MTALEHFEQFWARMPTELTSNLVHPDDLPFVDSTPAGSATLQLQVLPLPVNGNLREADIVLLMLNPNYDHDEEQQWEDAYPELASRRRAQQLAAFGAGALSGNERVFYDIDPSFQSSSGARHWRGGGKLGDIASALATARGSSLDEAWAEMARRIAVVQLVPYRSKTFNPRTCSALAPSCQHAVALAHWLVRYTDKLVIATRALTKWELGFPSTHPNLITYNPDGEARGAFLSLNSRGGRPLLERLLRPSSSQSQPSWSAAASSDTARPSPASDAAPAGPSRRRPVANPPIDRTPELVRIFNESGLGRLLVSKGVKPPDKQPFSKLHLKSNDYRLSSLEFHDKAAGPILRVHYLPRVSDWILQGMAAWPAYRGADRSGTNLAVDGDPLELAVALANLLRMSA